MTHFFPFSSDTYKTWFVGTHGKRVSVDKEAISIAFVFIVKSNSRGFEFFSNSNSVTLTLYHETGLIIVVLASETSRDTITVKSVDINWTDFMCHQIVRGNEYSRIIEGLFYDRRKVVVRRINCVDSKTVTLRFGIDRFAMVIIVCLLTVKWKRKSRCIFLIKVPMESLSSTMKPIQD
jgi:hypothetical protein